MQYRDVSLIPEMCALQIICPEYYQLTGFQNLYRNTNKYVKEKLFAHVEYMYFLVTMIILNNDEAAFDFYKKILQEMFAPIYDGTFVGALTSSDWTNLIGYIYGNGFLICSLNDVIKNEPQMFDICSMPLLTMNFIFLNISLQNQFVICIIALYMIISSCYLVHLRAKVRTMRHIRPQTDASPHHQIKNPFGFFSLNSSILF